MGDTVDMDGAATTDLMATIATTERGQQTPSQRPLLPLTLTRTLMLGTATMATDTVDMDTVATTGRGLPSLSPLLLLSPRLMLIPGTAMDTVDMDTAATTGLMVTTATMESGPQMLSLLPSLQLMLMPGTATTATVDMATEDTATGDMAATTAHMD